MSVRFIDENVYHVDFVKYDDTSTGFERDEAVLSGEMDNISKLHEEHIGLTVDHFENWCKENGYD
jgi:hypothetical protein